MKLLARKPRHRRPFESNARWRAILHSYWRAVVKRRPLPPGDWLDIDSSERRRRTLLIERARRFGPVFKGMMQRRLVVCVVGHEQGRRLLKENAASMRPTAPALETLFPHGLMRGMQGEVHREYRKALVRAIAATPITNHVEQITEIARVGLARYGALPTDQQSSRVLADILGDVAAGALICYCFGLAPDSTQYRRVLAAYKVLGPHGIVWNITQREVAAYRALLDEVAALPPEPRGVLGALRAQGAIDETMLGNLIYMVEIGRYDLRGLLRWITRYAGAFPMWTDRIAAERPGSGVASPAGLTLGDAFVLETLRMDQSERLMREVGRDFVFDGWLIPAGALVRVCMWEAHKNADAFPAPFEFAPSRFLGAAMDERFSPFGLDHHHCPFAKISIDIARTFLEVLAAGWHPRTMDKEPAVRGPYHWEPSPSLTVTLEPRSLAPHSADAVHSQCA